MELTYNWDPEVYTGGRNFGHLAYAVDDIYATCATLQKAGVVINRPPRDGRMAFIRTPDAISIELIQKGGGAGARRALGVDGQYRGMVISRDGVHTIAALTRLRNSRRKYSRCSGACTIRIANSASRGEIQNTVPATPPQKYSPTAPAVGAMPGSSPHREAEPEAVARATAGSGS